MPFECHHLLCSSSLTLPFWLKKKAGREERIFSLIDGFNLIIVFLYFSKMSSSSGSMYGAAASAYSAGIIVAIVIGSVIVFAILFGIILCGYCLCCRKPKLYPGMVVQPQSYHPTGVYAPSSFNNQSMNRVWSKSNDFFICMTRWVFFVCDKLEISLSRTNYGYSFPFFWCIETCNVNRDRLFDIQNKSINDWETKCVGHFRFGCISKHIPFTLQIAVRKINIQIERSMGVKNLKKS